MEWIKDKKWWSMAGGRAVRTVAQAMLATIGSSATMLHEVNWLFVLSAGALGGIVSILTSIAVGMPEYKKEDE
jgi:hypothetical protein